MENFRYFYSFLSPDEKEQFNLAMASIGNRTGYTLERNLESERAYESFADFIDTIFRWSATPQGQNYWESFPAKHYRFAPYGFKLLRWSATGEELRIDDIRKAIGVLRHVRTEEQEKQYLTEEDINTGLFKKVGPRQFLPHHYGYEYALISDIVNLAHFSGSSHRERHYNLESRFVWEGVRSYWIKMPKEAQEYQETAGHNYWANEGAMNNAGYILQDGAPVRCSDIEGMRPAFIHYQNDGVKFEMIPQDLTGFLLMARHYNHTANDSEIINVIEAEQWEAGNYGGEYAEDYNGEIVDDALLVNGGTFGYLRFSEQFIENTREIYLNGYPVNVDLVYTDSDTFLNPPAANYCNHYFCSDCDEWYNAENCGDEHDHSYNDDEDENSPNNPRFSYHSCEHYDYSENSEYKVGFEIEKECEDGCAHSHYDIRSRFGWVKERDGSLDDETGYELVSPQYDLFSPKLMEDANKIEEHYPKLINGAVSSSCGGHVHFSKAETMGSDLLESICGYLPVLYSIYEHRINKSYCEVKEKEEMKRSDNKYQAVKVMRGRIEFRIFPAVKNLQVMEWRLNLIRIMAKNPSANPLEVIKTLTNSRTELHKHFAKIFSRGAIYRKAQKALEYAKKFDSNYFNVDMRADVRAINKKVSRLNKADAKKMEALAKELSAFAESIN